MYFETDILRHARVPICDQCIHHIIFLAICGMASGATSITDIEICKDNPNCWITVYVVQTGNGGGGGGGWGCELMEMRSMIL